MERPLHAETWKRTVTSAVDREMTDGETVWPSITSRAGEVTLPMSSVPVPAAGQPLTEMGGGVALFALTTSVALDSAEAEPSAFFAVTRTRSVSPTSPPRTRYED